MKKLFITALFALLMGGFAINANAQGKVVTKNALGQQDNTESIMQTKINDFEAAVNTFEKDLNTWKEGKSTDKINLKDDKKKAEKAQSAVNELLPKMTEKQSTKCKNLSIKLTGLIENYKELMSN